MENNLVYEKKWWYEISIILRKLIENKEYKKAYNLVDYCDAHKPAIFYGVYKKS